MEAEKQAEFWLNERSTMDQGEKPRVQDHEEFFRLIVEHSADAIIVVDRGGMVRFLNPAAEHLFGRTSEQMVGKSFGFPMAFGIPLELNILRPGQESRVAEMRVAEIAQHNETLYMANLRDITELVRLREDLRTMALIDDLTGLNNRRGFSTLGQQQVKLADRAQRGMFLLFSDLDNLKLINDTFGHHEGDQALIETANIHRETFRQSDIIARVGGDEFAVLAIESHKGSGEILAARLQERLRTHNTQRNRRYKLSISVGLDYYDPTCPRSIDELLDQADRSMYEQKQKKRNTVDRASWFVDRGS
jgi:two-component system cell cycle response regulator